MMTGELQKTRAAIHGSLFLATFMMVTTSFPTLSWPWHLVLPVLIYAGIVLLVGPLRRTAPMLAFGRLGGGPLLYAAAVALGASGVLVGFQAVVKPDVSSLATKIPVESFGNLLLAGVGFSVINSVAEELIFRGILWELVSDEWNQGAALGVTAFLFGVGHVEGYPPGLIGAVLAGLYGVALGVLRWWSGGLALASACHVGADATIFGMLVAAGSLDAA